MVLTGLTKLKLGDVFKDMPNVTIATSSGLLYSWGESIRSVDDDTVEEDGHEATGERAVYSHLSPFSYRLIAGGGLRKWGCFDFNIDWEAVRNIAGLPLRVLI